MEPKTSDIPHFLWLETLRTRGHGRLNHSALARAIGEKNAKLHYYLHGLTRWPAHIWLRSLFAAGFARFEGGSLTIRLAVPDFLVDEVTALNHDDAASRQLFRRKQRTAATVASGVQSEGLAEENGLTYVPTEDNVGEIQTGRNEGETPEA